MTENIAILKKYNFWENKFPSTGLIRNNYLDKINDFIGNKLIKVLVGQRRVGKSYLLRQTIFRLIENGENPKNIFYINKEYTDFDFITNYKELETLIKVYKKEVKPKGKVYIFIDEIQNITGWEHLINSYSQNYTNNYEIFISGSNSQLLSGELASLLSGRYIQFQILPFSYQEYISIKHLENSKKSFLQYLQTGGLPELFHLPNDETKRHYVSSIKDTVILRDIIQRYNIKDARLLQDIFSFLVNNASDLISISSIVKYFAGKNRKTNYETVANYIEYLKNTFLIHQVDRYNIKGKEVLAGNYKYYINDLSFKNYLYSGFEYGLGYMLENIIYLQLINSGYNVYIGYLRNKEIDFVATKNNKTIYLQVAYLLIDKNTIEREYSELESIPDNFEKYVVSLDDIALPNKNGIKHVLAWQINDIL
ncbi:MAG: AAA family ATPase [Bacteroidetes bacterium CG23_combo_of_CG06-09_8_20_14_all_32_9]|nr:MAG: AAA family ATPase [Bacteroidetes bacterium CG23_combo_of_CG06-09_8_20_14_all_32_9]